MKNSFEDRLQQVKQQGGRDAIPQLGQQENFLNFVNPTEFVELPSRGKFYPEGHPFKDKESIEIRQMTAKEEDILTNKSLIKKGIVVDRLIDSLLVEKVDVSSIIAGDKNAILVAARISAYGPSYDVSLGCTECGNKSILSIDLREISIREANEIIKEIVINDTVDSQQLESGNIIVKLPKTGWIVECKLMTGMEELKILSILEAKKKIDPNADLTISEQLEVIISSINAVYDPQIIRQAINVMPAFDAKHLRGIYQKMIPNVKIEKEYICSSCGEEQEVEVPFTQEFFWPK